MIRSEIFQDWFSTREMREIFSDRNTVQQWLNAEAALAQAQAATGLIPPHASEAITQKADAALIAFEPLREHYHVVGYPILPLLKVWEEQLGEAARYVHWGATTQDITDTGLVLQIKQALFHLEHDLAALISTLAALARKHRHTLMAGRTHGQHAVPITFGFKAAIWLAELKRHRARFDALKPRLLVGQLAGAGGTLASLGAQGAGIRAEMMRRLGLAVPSIAWHSARDSFGEFACCLALLGATMEKMAHEVELLQKNEVAELSESYETGKGASSTMPQKRNPSNCEAVIALGRLLREQVPSLLGAMTQEHERDWWAVHIEWKEIPEMCCLCAAALVLSLRWAAGGRGSHATESRDHARAHLVGGSDDEPGPEGRAKRRPRIAVPDLDGNLRRRQFFRRSSPAKPRCSRTFERRRDFEAAGPHLLPGRVFRGRRPCDGANVRRRPAVRSRS